MGLPKEPKSKEFLKHMHTTPNGLQSLMEIMGLLTLDRAAQAEISSLPFPQEEPEESRELVALAHTHYPPQERLK